MRAWCALILLVGCEGPVLSLANRAFLDGAVGDGAVGSDARPDADVVDENNDQNGNDDDELVPCSSASACPPASEPDRTLCNLTLGYCVECINDNDCPSGERCEPDGDCDD